MNTFPYPAKQRPRARSRIMFLEAWECFKEAVLILLLIELPAFFLALWRRVRNFIVPVATDANHPRYEGYFNDTVAVIVILCALLTVVFVRLGILYVKYNLLQTP